MNTNKLRWKPKNEEGIEKYKNKILQLGKSIYKSNTSTVEIDMCIKDITAKNIYKHLKDSWTEEFKEMFKGWKVKIDEYIYIECDVEDIIINDMQPQPFPNECLFTLNISANFISKYIIKEPISLNKELQKLYSMSSITVTDIGKGINN